MEKLLGYLVALVTFGVSQRRKKDRLLFDRLMAELPPDSTAIALLKEHDMGDSFEYKRMAPLDRAVNTWHDPDKLFLTKSVEQHKEQFVTQLDTFLRLFAKRSGGEGGGRVSIGMKDYEDRPDMMKYREELNKLATRACDQYSEFVKHAHKKLPV